MAIHHFLPVIWTLFDVIQWFSKCFKVLVMHCRRSNAFGPTTYLEVQLGRKNWDINHAKQPVACIPDNHGQLLSGDARPCSYLDMSFVLCISVPLSRWSLVACLVPQFSNVQSISSSDLLGDSRWHMQSSSAVLQRKMSPPTSATQSSSNTSTR